MLEGLVASLLNRFLGAYVDNFDPKQLKIAIWNGDVKLQNLKIKKEALNKLNLPIEIHTGYLEQLTLKLPWSNLRNEPVKLHIDGLFLLAEKRSEFIGPDEIEKREQELKQQMLSSLEIMIENQKQFKKQSKNLDNTDDDSNKNLTESFISKIVDNLQVTIGNIHFRYEEINVPNNENINKLNNINISPDFAIGFTLNELSAISSNINWEPNFIQVSQAITHKLITLKSFGVYWDPNAKSIKNDDDNSIENLLMKFKETISQNTSDGDGNANGNKDSNYIISPISGTGRVTLNKSGSTPSNPKTAINLLFNNIGIELNSIQYNQFLSTITNYQIYKKTEKFKKLRPLCLPREDPKKWIKYVVNVIYNEIHERNFKNSWEFFKKRREERKSYINLFKIKHINEQSNKITSPQELEEFNELERILSYEDIRFYRSLARIELKKENALVKQQEKLDNKDNDNKNNGGGWTAWIWGSKDKNSLSNEGDDDDDIDEDVVMDDQQRKELFDAIEYDEQSQLTESLDIPKDRVTFELITSVQNGSFTISQPNIDETNLNSKSKSLMVLKFDDFKALFYQRPDSFLTICSLQEFKVEDGTKDTIYKNIVSASSNHDAIINNNINSEEGISTRQKTHPKDPLFYASFENNPLDGSADTALFAKLQSMTVFYNVRFIEELYKFFTPPQLKQETIGILMNAAESTVEGLTNQTRIGLEFALQEHKTINLKMDLQAPLIILPSDSTDWKSSCAIIDSGHITIESNLADKTIVDEVYSKINQRYTKEDWDRLKSLMYDRFNLKLKNTQILIGPNIKEALKELTDTSSVARNCYVLDKFNVDLLLQVSILQSSSDLVMFKISAELPIFRASISDKKYKILMELITKCIPNFENANIITIDDDSNGFSGFGLTTTEFDNPLEIISSSETLSNDHEDIDELKSLTSILKQVPESSSIKNNNLLDFSFKVNTFQVELFKCINESSFEQEALAVLNIENFGVVLSLANNDISVDVFLNALYIDDLIEKTNNAEFKRLVSSSSTTTKDNDMLFKLKFAQKERKVLDESNSLKDEISIFDQTISLQMSDIIFVFTRGTVLTLIDFIITTFVGDNPEEIPQAQNDSSTQLYDPMKLLSQHLDVKVDLSSITLILNDDGIKIATLKLSQANVDVSMVDAKLKVISKIGGLTLHDEENQTIDRESDFRKLLSIEGNDFADFRYETFDANDSNELFTQSIYLHSGLIKFNFIEKPIKNIFNFITRFSKMKEIYDSATAAAISQAQQIESPGRIHFDILIKSPIIVFPKLVPGSGKIDKITVNLGEIYAQNKFSYTGGGKYHILNEITAGVRDTLLTSHFYFDDNDQKLNVLDNVDLILKVSYNEDGEVLKKPRLVITSSLSEIDVKLTELQLNYLLTLSTSIPKVFEVEDYEDDNEIKKEVAILKGENPSNAKLLVESVARQDSSAISSENIDPRYTNLTFEFKANKVSLSIFNNTKGESDISKRQLSKFSLNGVNVTFNANEDGSFYSYFHIHSFTVHDMREIRENMFTEVISSLKGDNHQFMGSATSTRGKITLLLSVDAFQTIVALDYIFAVKSFVDVAIASTTVPPKVSEKSIRGKSVSDSKVQLETNEKDSSSSQELVFTVNINDTSIILLADPTKKDSEAVVFGVDEFVISSRKVLDITGTNIGMYLCRMDAFDKNPLKILDDFSFSTSIDSNSENSKELHTKIKVSVDALILRLSTNDISLALSIISKALELNESNSSQLEEISGDIESSSQYIEVSEDFQHQLSARKNSINPDGQLLVPSTISRVIREELEANIAGVRVVLIGARHELPTLDVCIKPFRITGNDWSTNMLIDTTINSFINVYNYSASSWEPLVEPWSISARLSKDSETGLSSLDIDSKENIEITLTSGTVNLFSELTSQVTNDKDNLIRSRTVDAPYRVLNQTGYKLRLWIDSDKQTNNRLTEIEDGEEIPWSFEDWKEIRENLNIDNQKSVFGVELMDAPYSPIKGISVTAEGEEVYGLRPKRQGYFDRLVCTVKLRKDNVKYITFGSTLKFFNETQVPIKIGTYIDDSYSREWIIESNESRSLPIQYVHDYIVNIKPSNDLGFGWSKTWFDWKHIPSDGAQYISTCETESSNDNTTFNFQVTVEQASTKAVSHRYPIMNINISPPLEIVNLLPFDISYSIYDRSARRDWRNYLKKGESSQVHVVHLSNILLLSVLPKDSGFSKSGFAIINAPRNSGFSNEYKLSLKHNDGQKMFLRIHYEIKKGEGSGMVLYINSPYLIVNKTGLELMINEKYNVMTSEVSEDYDNNKLIRKAEPKMFSFESDEKSNRALLRVGNSEWSSPISFEAIGSSIDVGMKSSDKRTEIHAGVYVTEGTGQYKYSKIVTITPRYIIKNNMPSDMLVKEFGSGNHTTVETKGLLPLYFLNTFAKKQLVLSFSNETPSWTSSFTINDIGATYIKIYKKDKGHTLIKVEVLLENATLFIHLTEADNQWPFSIRNFTNKEFIFYQCDPTVDEDGNKINNTTFEPIYFKLTGKSIMNYAWDYPSAPVKELILQCDGTERHVQLAEIGNLPPMKIISKESINESNIFDLNVVADGIAQSLVISNYNPSSSLYKLSKGKNSNESSRSLSSTTSFEIDKNEKKDNLQSKVSINFNGIGISLINKKTELCYLTIKGSELKYTVSDLYETVTLKIKWLQLDNQLFGSSYPIVLYPSSIQKNSMSMNSHPMLSGSISKVKDNSYGITFIKYATILLQETCIELDTDFLFSTMNFFSGIKTFESLTDNNNLLNDITIPEPQQASSSKIYFEILHLQPIKLNLSFTQNVLVNSGNEAAKIGYLKYIFDILSSTIGNVNDAPIKLNALYMENVRSPLPTLLQSISTHYSQGLLYQVYNILGSADFLGNPVGLFNNLSSGVVDIFYQPYQGFIMNERPQELGIELAKGGLSFFQKSLFGISDSFAKLTGSVSRGLTAATMDESYQNRRSFNSNNKRNRPTKALSGFSQGANSFVEGITSGISGLALNPMQGASEEGTSGFLKGIGRGIIGLPTKTTIGIFDMASNISEGIRSSTNSGNQALLERSRLTRNISYDGVVKPYVKREAQGQFWLKMVNKGQFFKEDYIDHVIISNDQKAVIVSLNYVICVILNRLETQWIIGFSDIFSISVEHGGITIQLKGGKQGPFIMIQEESTKKEFYSSIAIAVNKFNR